MSEVQTVPNEARENVTHEEGPSQEFEPLFEDEGGFSEDELTGDTPQENGDQTPEKKETEPPASEGEEPKETPKEEPEKSEEKPKEEPKETKPPEGYVEIQALHAERHKRREAEDRFQNQIDNLKAQLYSMQKSKEAPKEEDPWKDFKLLNDQEFADLKDEDPDETGCIFGKHECFPCI